MTTAAQQPRTLRLGCVRYLNTLPLIEGLEKAADIDLVPAAPARLIDLLLARDVDAALISIIDAQRSPEPLTLIPSGMIGCDGPTLTVRLYSAAPLERITTLAADADSHTAIALCRVLLARRFGVTPRVADFAAPVDAARAASAEWPEAVLLIGDKVVTAAPPPSRYPHTLDLGEAWKEWTGLPFVYAAWACRAEDAASPRARLIRDLLDRQRRHNATRLDWIVASRAPERGWPTGLAADYVGNLLRYDPGEPDSPFRAAVERFFDEAHALGLAPRRAPVRWLDAPHT